MTDQTDQTDQAEYIYGPWEHVAEEIIPTEIPHTVNGFGKVIDTKMLAIHHERQRRKVWKFVGYEERTVES